MTNGFGKVTRISAIVAVIVALMFVATPVLQLGGKSVTPSPVGEAAAARGDRVFNVGVIDYGTGIATVNPWMYTMSAEYETIWPCYSTLLTYDENANMVGDLATSWSISPNGTVWNFKIANNAYFIDPANPTSTAHKVTANDVFWSFWEVQNDTLNHLSSYFNLGGGNLIIKKMWTGVDLFDIYIQMNFVYSPFLGALATIPIVPKYIWSPLGAPGARAITSYPNLPIIGSGFFYYGNGASLPGQVGVLKRNPIWFNEVNRGWQIHVDTLNYKSQSDEATAWLELTKADPTIDVYLTMGSSQYIANLLPPHTTPNTIGFAMATGFEYEYQFNQLTPAYRTALENAGLVKKGGSNNPLINNPTVMLALSMSIDRPTFVQLVSDGLATIGDSVIPGCNRWHLTNPNPLPFNTAAARTVLNNAGWAYDSGGNYNPGTTPLYKAGGVDGLAFNMLTLNTDPDWQTGANLLVQWAAQAGVQYTLNIVSVSQANGAWYSGNYDTWLWDWVFTPSSDPSTDVLSVHTTMAIGTWSGSFFHNATFDDLYNRSLLATTDAARRVLVDEMQMLLYASNMVNYISYPQYLYGASTVHWNKASYGNWNAHYTLMPDQGYPWLYMKLSPVDNLAPTVSVSIAGGYDGYVGTPVNVGGSSSQTTDIEYQWYWGDGTTSGWLPSASYSHTYAKDGDYTVYFASRQTLTADGYSGWNQTHIRITDPSNQPPVLSAISMTPSTGITTATYIDFSVTATDPNGDQIYYMWDLGDGFTSPGNTVTHRYSSVGPGGSWTVHAYATDNRQGSAMQVSTRGVSIVFQYPPQLSMPPNKVVLKNTLTTFSASASDQNGDPLRFTWYWGDGPGGTAGPPTVTTTPSATHSYSLVKFFDLVVYADDLSALPTNNVSAACVVNVRNVRSPPFGATITALPTAAWTGQNVTFTGSAQDPDGDAMQFNFTFGDGTYQVVNKAATAPNAVVTSSVTHAYATAGIKTAYMAATDGLDTATSTNVQVTVTLNTPPVVVAQSAKTANNGTALSFSATANDAEETTLRYTWDFGDGVKVVSRTTTHTYAKPGIYTFKVSVDDLTGVPGHNVSSSATASIAFNLPLNVGWNFVSVPVVGFGYKASTIGLAFGDVIVGWNSTRQLYDKNYIKGISPSTADFAIAPNTAYWIWVAAAKTLHLYGSVPTTTQTVAYVVPITGGWVAVGLVGLNAVRHALDLTSWYTPSNNMTLVAKFTGTGYVTYIKGTPLNNFLLVPGAGYWCWVKASGTMSYIP